MSDITAWNRVAKELPERGISPSARQAIERRASEFRWDKLGSIRRIVRALIASAAFLGTSSWLDAPTALGQANLSNEQTLEVEQLGERGVVAFQAGDYAAALPDLEKGYEISGWGTVGVWLAKTLEELGRPMDAYAVYSEVAASAQRPEEPAPFAAARQEAKEAVAKLELSYAVIDVEADDAASELEVVVDGTPRRLSSTRSLAVEPGEVEVEVRWNGGRLPTKSYSLQAGQHLDLDLTGRAGAAQAPVSDASETQTFHRLDFSMVEMEGWTLHDAAGRVICELPCTWSGTDPETLSVRKAEQNLPVRLGRKSSRSPELGVTVNPQRGSKGWALGLGIPAGILFGASLLAAANPEAEYPAAAATGAVVFGAGFGACAWWFIWSKSRPYLEYEVKSSAEAAQTARLELDFYGTGLGLRGSF